MIKKLLLLEWSKFSKNTVITLLTTFFFIFLPTSLYFGKYLKDVAGKLKLNVNILEAPLIWDYLGYAGNWIVFFFLGVLVIYTITIDVANKTMRQNIITGLSRKEYFISKLLIVLFYSFLATIYYTFLSVTVAWFNTENFDISALFDNERAIPRFWLMSFAYLNFAMFLAFLFRKSGVAVFVYLTYMIIAEPLIKLLIQKYVMDNKFINYLPMNTAEDLMPAPIAKMAANLAGSTSSDVFLEYGEASILTVIYACLFLGLTYFSFLKKDL